MFNYIPENTFVTGESKYFGFGDGYEVYEKQCKWEQKGENKYLFTLVEVWDDGYISQMELEFEGVKKDLIKLSKKGDYKEYLDDSFNWQDGFDDIETPIGKAESEHMVIEQLTIRHGKVVKQLPVKYERKTVSKKLKKDFGVEVLTWDELKSQIT